MRLTQARCFLRHLKASVPETEVPGPGLLPRQPRPKPRLYSNEEITKLQQATAQLWKPGSLSQLTPYFIIGLLASTGLRAGEVIALTVDDVRLDSDLPQLHIRKAKFYKSRIVPIHSSTADQLRAYLQERNRVKLRRPSKAFFISGTGLIAPLVQSFFTDDLVRQRRASPQTVASYRDTFRLLLQHLSQTTGKKPSDLTLDDLQAKAIMRFLDDIERDRGNSVQTRNARLAAIRSFFRLVTLREPTRIDFGGAGAGNSHQRAVAPGSST
jgi:integrase